MFAWQADKHLDVFVPSATPWGYPDIIVPGVNVRGGEHFFQVNSLDCSFMSKQLGP